MRITPFQKRALTLTAAGLAAAIAGSQWSRKRYDFEGKVVVITGGSRGLGLVLARQLVRDGARVTLIARDADELDRAAGQLRSLQSRADVFTVQADVRRQADVDRAVARTIDRHGRVDVVINNAGIIQVGPLDHMKVSDYDDAIKTHFWGPLYMTLAVLPHMRSQGTGRIVNISSIGGRIAVPHLLPYSVSKFALAGLSDGLRAELARENIVVTGVFPGLMRTGSAVNALFKGRRAQEYAWFAILGALPVSSIGAERAARQILDACRRGDAELIITAQAHLAVLARTLVPEIFAEVVSLVSRLLPAAAGPREDTARPGKASESSWAPSLLTAPTYAAARRNNEL